MPEVKVQSAKTNVVIALTEREASVLLTVLYDAIDFDTSPEIRELAEALDDVGLSSNAVKLAYNPQSNLFEGKLMRLDKGTLKVLVSDLNAAVENQKRARAGGKIFVPVYTVYEWDEDMKVLEVHKAHSYSGQSLKPRTTVASNFPYAWAPTVLKSTLLWLETKGELNLSTTQEDI